VSERENETTCGWPSSPEELYRTGLRGDDITDATFFPGMDEAILSGRKTQARRLAGGVIPPDTMRVPWLGVTLQVIRVWREPLQDISDEDARAEGIHELPLQEGQSGAWWTGDVAAGSKLHGRTPAQAFRLLWDSLYGNRPGARWEDNPTVWVIHFRVLPAERATGT
jgi:hypothetical protein